MTRIGDAHAAIRVLVVGAIHGNETAGMPVVARLRAHPPRLAPGVALWLVSTINPDGVAAGTRQNGRGVDLNRNFPDGWRAQGAPGSTFYSGPRPLSEPESRAVVRLVSRVRPDVTIWYHQALRLVDVGTVADRRVPWTYARAAGMRALRMAFLPGVATRWENRRFPGSSAFVVELPAGPLSPAAVARHARAVALAAGRARRDRAAGSPGPARPAARTLG